MSRHYNLEGTQPETLGRKSQYPSVTTVLPSPDLKDWAAGMSCDYIRNNIDANMSIEQILGLIETARKEWRTISDEAMNIGTEVHALAEDDAKGIPVDLTGRREEVANGFKAYLDWKGQYIKRFIAVEVVVYSDEYRYAGTADVVAELNDGRIALIDYKTSKGFFSGYDLQLCAYKFAYEEMNPEKEGIDTVICLRLDKVTGLPQHKEYKDIDRLTQCWLHMIQAWWLEKKRRLKVEGPVGYDAKIIRSDA